MAEESDIDITSNPLNLDGLVEDLENFPDRGQLQLILDSGKNPDEFLQHYESRLHSAEVKAISDYIDEADNLVELNVRISECDKILENLESVLNKYEGTLSSISSEILGLQRASEDMRSRVDNRKHVQAELGSFIERIVLLPSLVNHIMKSPANSNDFGVSVRQLHAKLDFVAENEDVRASAAFRDVAIEMERIRLAAVRKCRDLLMEKVYEMRNPHSNIQVQENVLLRYRFMLTFLHAHGRSMYDEVHAAYAVTVSTKFLEVFKSYWASIEQMELAVVPEDLLLGSPVSSSSHALSNMMSLLQFGKGASAQESGSMSEVFDAGERLKILEHVHHSPLIPGIDREKHPYEVLFMSVSKLLVDTAAHEYLFCKSFWLADGTVIFKEVFKPVIDFVHGSLQASLHEMHDPVALLLCIKINREHFLYMSKRRNPALDEHFDAVNLMIWPRLKGILDHHMTSLEAPHYNVTESIPDVLPYKVIPVTERYAIMASSILILNCLLDDGSLSLNIERLRYSVLNLLLATSREFPKRGSGTIFLLHNLQHIISTMKAAFGGVDSSLVGEDHARVLEAAATEVLLPFEDAFSRALDLYVDSRVMAGIPQICNFVKAGESAMAKGNEASVDFEAASVIAKDFSGRWEKVIKVLNTEIRQDFPTTSLCELVQQTAYSRLLLLWSKFLELLKRKGQDGAELVNRSVSIPSIMYALRESDA